MPVLSDKNGSRIASTTHAVGRFYAGSVADAALDLARRSQPSFGGKPERGQSGRVLLDSNIHGRCQRTAAMSWAAFACRGGQFKVDVQMREGQQAPDFWVQSRKGQASALLPKTAGDPEQRARSRLDSQLAPPRSIARALSPAMAAMPALKGDGPARHRPAVGRTQCGPTARRFASAAPWSSTSMRFGAEADCRAGRTAPAKKKKILLMYCRTSRRGSHNIRQSHPWQDVERIWAPLLGSRPGSRGIRQCPWLRARSILRTCMFANFSCLGGRTQ